MAQARGGEKGKEGGFFMALLPLPCEEASRASALPP